jgi:hypothetical protein
MAGLQQAGRRDLSCWVVAEMSATDIEINSETSRVRAALVNSGRHTFSEAEQKLAASRLTIAIGDEAAGTVAGQAAFLTATVTAARCFGQLDVEVLMNLCSALCRLTRSRSPRRRIFSVLAPNRGKNVLPKF